MMAHTCNTGTLGDRGKESQIQAELRQPNNLDLIEKRKQTKQSKANKARRREREAVEM